MGSLEVDTTSKNTSKVKGTIDIRQNEVSYIHLDLTIVDNPKSPECSLEGKLIVEKKGNSEEWTKERLSVSTLVKGQHTELNLKPDELFALHKKLCQLYDSFPSSNGNYYGKYVQYDGSAESIIEFLESDPYHPLFGKDAAFEEKCKLLAEILSNPKVTPESLKSMLLGNDYLTPEQMTNLLRSLGDCPELLGVLQTIDSDRLSSLHRTISLAQMIDIADTIENHLDCGDEKKWQKFFDNHKWILEQLFIIPMCYHLKEIYTGVPGDDGKGANSIDFGLLHAFSSEYSLVEIKTPAAPLIKKSTYRNNAYDVSDAVSGGMIQILNGRMELISRYAPEPGQDKVHPAFQPKCVLLVGRYDSLVEDKMKRSFELFRSNVSGVDIITFDELLYCIRAIIELLTGERALSDSRIDSNL